MENARCKALEVYSRLNGPQPPSCVVGADTVVVRGGRILEKPPTAEAAKAMLAELSGAEHDVMTGVAIVYPPGDGERDALVHTFCERTAVTFGALTPELIDAYVATGEPMDKAGGYGIQGGLSASFVSGISGCYYNVVGFPLHRFAVELDCDRLRRFVDARDAGEGEGETAPTG